MSGGSGLGCKLLKGMGWTEGSGIGKSGNGIVEPIKPRLKVGTAGIGYRESEQLCSGWWMDAFNKAAAATQPDSAVAKQLNQSASAPLLGRPYQGFSAPASVSIFSNGREVATPAASDSAASDAATAAPLPPTPSDAELLAACRGRTAHAAARFGLGMGGKLARVRAHDLRMGWLAGAEHHLDAGADADEEEKSERRKRRRERRKRRRAAEGEQAADESKD